MSGISHAPSQSSPTTSPCPSWCVTQHGAQIGEEDWVHMGSPVFLPAGVTVRVCMSVDPASLKSDGPRIVTDDGEWTAAHARNLGRSLIALAEDLENLENSAGLRRDTALEG